MAATMIKAHKIRLNPTPEQEEYLRRATGMRRFVYNWGLAEWNKQYAEYKEGKREKKPTANALKKQFQAIREKEFPWTFAVTKCVIEGAFDDLGDAFSRFFKGQNQYPTFKKKNKSRESFYVANDKCSIGDHWMVIPVLGQFLMDKQQANGTLPQKIRNKNKYKRGLGKVNMAEALRFVVSDPSKKAGKWRNERKKRSYSSVKIMGATIGLSGGHWSVSIHVEVPAISVINTHPIVGVDVGIKEAAIVSDGRRFENQKPLSKQIKKLKRLSRSFSRKQYDPETKQGSKNREKARVNWLACTARWPIFARMSITSSPPRLLGRAASWDWKTCMSKACLRTANLPERWLTPGSASCCSSLKEKCRPWGGRPSLWIGFSPRQKHASGCGHVKKRMPLKYRTYSCLECGSAIDRDLNAAINLEREARRILIEVLHVPVADSGSGPT